MAVLQKVDTLVVRIDAQTLRNLLIESARTEAGSHSKSFDLRNPVISSDNYGGFIIRFVGQP